MKIIDLYKKGEPILSFEVFPPRNGSLKEDTIHTVEDLMCYRPDYVSITYGSGGSLRGGTETMAHTIKEKFNVEVLPHLTCTDKSKEDIENTLMTFYYLGLENILALRGDPPEGNGKNFHPHPKGHKFASGIIEQIQNLNQGKYIIRPNDYSWYDIPKHYNFKPGRKMDFSIAAACYLDGHYETYPYQGNLFENFPKEPELSHLKNKVDKGVDFLITQVFYNPNSYINTVKKAKELDINIPIVPMIYPIGNNSTLDYIKNTLTRGCIDIPEDLEKIIRKYRNKENEKGQLKKLRGEVNEYMYYLCQTILDFGAPGLHIATSGSTKQRHRLMKDGLLKIIGH